MSKIINDKSISTIISSIKKSKKSICLVGGCFDILHFGHIKFLKSAKKLADILIILLEDDASVKKLKGKNRPIFALAQRQETLESLFFVDFIIPLKKPKTGLEYYELVKKIHPNIIAVTDSDPKIKIKKEQIRMINGKLKTIPYVKTYSSSRLAKILKLD